ncbi:MAG: circularly permuted type 2 ATP-grasp protein, partial [Acidobacteriota bacterium]
RIAHQIHENGVTYNVHTAARGPSRPWMLDVLPAIVTAGEWSALEHGLRQRARLLNAIAADLYGPQRLVTEGVVPPAVVFRHQGFLRACHGVKPPGGVFLHLVAFDLARGPDGAWRPVGTRAQAPSGLGYALENRATILRLFPDALRALRTRPLANFCDSLQDALLANAPSDDAPPLAVLLTPGPFNETYFEHAYLARQLGLPLVQGGDLAVRHNRVFLKTVAGLRRVHAIWRRMDDDYCDPLELRSDSTLGVAGLVQAWRAGNVLVANAFGLGVLESLGLLAFLEPACNRLLGESLVTAVTPTTWCGEPAGLEAALGQLPTGVIKSALNVPVKPVFGADLDASARAAWADRLRADPEAYVVQQFMPPSHVPVWGNDSDALESRALIVRAFLLADGRGDYALMPGGLARIAGDDRQTVSGQRGGGSKDLWVLSDTPVDSTLLVSPPAIAALGPRTTSSRAAEHLFWLGRYAERSENSARLLRAVLQRDTSLWPARYRPVLLRACRGQGLLPDEPRTAATADRAADAPDRDAAAANDWTRRLQRALISGLFDHETSHSVGYNVGQTFRVAASVRERLSSDNWRVLNQLSERLALPPAHEMALNDALELIDDSIVSLVAVGGLEMAHMTRDDGWRFLSIGRHLERISFVSATLDVIITEHATTEPALLEWLLDLSDSLITYRSRHLRRPEWPSVMDLLFFDEHNPRSALFQVAKVGKHIRLLPGAGAIEVVQEVVEQIDRLLKSVQPDGRQGHLFGDAALLEDLPRACERLAVRASEALTFHYFSHVYERPQTTGTT